MSEDGYSLNLGKSTVLPIRRDDCRAFFSLIFGKPDSKMVRFEERVTVDRNAIKDLCKKMSDKMVVSPADAYGNLALKFGNHTFQESSSFTEMDNLGWDTNDRTNELVLNWDLFFDVKGFDVPQRHVLKLTISQPFNPKNMIREILNSEDNIEFDKTRRYCYVKIDFVSPIIADELINLVGSWIKSIEVKGKKEGIVDWYLKSRFAETFVGYSLTAFVGVVGVVLLSYLEKHWVDSEASISHQISDSFRWFFFVTSSIWLSSKIGKWVVETCRIALIRSKRFTPFSLTKGDRDYTETLNSERASAIHKTMRWIFGTLFVDVMIGVFIAYLVIQMNLS